MLFLFLVLLLRLVLFLFGQIFVLLRLIVAESAEQNELFLLLRPLFVELAAKLVFVYFFSLRLFAEAAEHHLLLLRLIAGGGISERLILYRRRLIVPRADKFFGGNDLRQGLEPRCFGERTAL